jgi:YbbR domain-containing protein
MEQIRNLFHELLALLAGLVRPAARSVRENGGLAALSIVLAFGLWIFVTDAENPERTRVLPVNLEVQPVNLAADVAVSADLRTVQVRIRVEENAFNSLRGSDFEATVDLDGLAVGEYEWPVDVRALTDRGNLRIEEVLPEKIAVSLAQLVSKRVPVTVEAAGAPPADFAMGAPEAEDATVVVAGPQTKVDLVTQAIASIDVGGRTKSVDQAVRLEPRDQRGLLVESVFLEPSLTRVSIEIEQKEFSRALVISPQVEGEPALGYNVVSVSVSPATVIVSGSQSFIEGAVSIRTQPIDVDGAEDDIVRSVSLDVAPGTKVIGNANVTVTVRIAAALGQLVFAVPVSATGLDGDLNVTGLLVPVQVTLFGDLPVLLALNPNDIAASVDLKDRKAGTHRVRVKVIASDGVEVISVSPEEIEITLENR